MRALRVALWSCAALAAVLAAGLAIAAATFDPAEAFARLALAVHRETGRDLVAGRVRMHWSLTPRLTLDDVTLSNPPGEPRPAMARIGHVEASLRPAALFGGTAALSLQIAGVEVELDDANLQFHPEPAANPGPAGPPSPPRPGWFGLALERLDVADARAAYADGRATRSFTITSFHAAHTDADLAGGITGVAETSAGRSVVQLWLPFQRNSFEVSATNLDFGDLKLGALYVAGKGPDGILRVTAQGQWRGWPFAGGIDVDHPPASLDEKLPFSFQGMGVRLKGTLAQPRQLRGLDAMLTVEADDLSPWAGLGKSVPALHDVALGAHVIDMGGLRAGLALRGLHATAREGDLAGDLALGWAGRPTVRGTLSSSRLDLDAIRLASPPAGPAGPAAPSAAPDAAPDDAPAAAAAEPALPFGALRSADADLSLSALNVTAHGATFPRAEARLAVRDGRLRLDPAVLLTPGGLVQGAVEADAEPPRAALDLHAAGLRLAPLTDQVHGALDLDVSLAAQGATRSALASSLGGRAGFALIDGDASNALLAAALSEPLRAAHVSLELGGRTAIRCFALRLDAAAGVATVATLLLQSARVDLQGGGTADLAQRSLALQLRPTLHLGGASMATSLLVSGPFAHPAVRADAQGGRFGLSIGPPADAVDCAPALLAARGRAGPLPDAAPADARPRRPADLLRGFIR